MAFGDAGSTRPSLAFARVKGRQGRIWPNLLDWKRPGAPLSIMYSFSARAAIFVLSCRTRPMLSFSELSRRQLGFPSGHRSERAERPASALVRSARMRSRYERRSADAAVAGRPCRSGCGYADSSATSWTARRVPAENAIRAAQAACSYSWRVPPSRSRRGWSGGRADSGR
jgi:hypothetical protein